VIDLPTSDALRKRIDDGFAMITNTEGLVLDEGGSSGSW
jgi:hypothetical protein